MEGFGFPPPSKRLWVILIVVNIMVYAVPAFCIKVLGF